jgi:hypothetical protein
MTIKTFNPNRVGGGTFELEQDATTGEYKLKEVGFIKLPELKLPEIDQADPIIPDPADPSDPSDPSDPGTGGGGSGGGGDNQQLDYTGTRALKNIQDEATKFAKQDTGIDRTSMDQGAIQISGLREKEAYDKAVANYNAFAERNRDLAMGKQPLTEEQRLVNQADLAAARNRMDSARKSFEDTFETVKAAPVISEDLQKFGPTTVESGTLMGTKTPITSGTFTKESIDESFLGEEGTTTKKNILQVAGEKAKKILDNSLPVKALVGIGKGLQALEDSLLGPQQVALNRSNKNALNSLGYKTRGELGGSTDPNRIAGNPADNVFAGMNATSARGNIMTGSANRIKTRETVGIQRVEARYGKNSKQAKDFRAKTEKFKNQRQEVFDAKEKEQAKINQETMNQGPPGGTDKERDSKIVCTMMNESYGFGSFRNKIWMKFHGDIAPEYQKGYHKLFLPLVNYAKQKGITNKIIKNILEHIAVHSTIDMRQTLRGKTHILGRVYRKVILPLCYWAGRK